MATPHPNPLLVRAGRRYAEAHRLDTVAKVTGRVDELQRLAMADPLWSLEQAERRRDARCLMAYARELAGDEVG